MASEIRVNRLSNRSGLSTITFANGGVQFSGITTFANGEFYVGTGATIINPGTNEFNFHTGGSNRFTINNSGANLGTGNITAVDATFTGNVSIGKTLTYEDVKNVDSVGVVTARTGVKVTGGDFTVGTAITASSVTGNVTNDVGITTFSGSAVWFKGATANKDMYWSHASGATVYKDNAQILMGDSSDLQIYHSGSHSFIKDAGTGMLKICADMIDFRNAADNATLAYAQEGNKFELFYNGSAKLATTNTGIDVTGDITISDKIIHDGDTNTAIRFPAADTVSVETAGSERLRITGDGPHLLLGGTSDVNEITESSANAGMVIGGTGFGNGGLAIINSTSGTGRIYFGDSTGNSAARQRGQINYYHSSDYMIFATAGTERLRIDSVGRHGINVTNAGDYYSAADDLIIREKDGGDSGITIRTGTANSGLICFADGASSTSDQYRRGQIRYHHNSDSMDFTTGGNTARLTITSGGVVNIGANLTQTTYPFSVQKDLDSGGNLAYFANSDGTYNQGITLSFDSNKDVKWAGGSGSGGLIWNMGTRGYVWQIGGSEKFRIDSSGRLLVGTTTEGHSNGDDLTLNNSGNCGLTLRSGTSSNGNIFFSDATSGGAEYQGMIWYAHGDDSMRFATSQTTRLVIKSTGLVNILGDSGNDGFYLSNAYGQAGIFGGMYYNGSSWVRAATGTRKGAGMYVNTGGHIAFLKAPETSGTSATVTESARITSDGNLLINGSTYYGTGTGSLQVHDAQFILSKPSGGNTRNWRFINNNTVAGNLGIQMSTASGGTTYATVMDFTKEGRAHFGPNATDIQLIPHSTNSGHGQLYFRGNASNESSSIKLNHYGHADYVIGAGRQSNGMFSITRTDGGTDGLVMNSSGRIKIGGAPETLTGNGVNAKLQVNTGSNDYDGIMLGGGYNRSTITTGGTYDLVLTSNAYPANATSSGIRFKCGSSGGGGPNERMRIYSEGYVTKPAQPRFLAYRGSSSISNISNGTITGWNNVKYDVGSNFSNGTKFTAPVTGTYMFGCNIRWGCSGKIRVVRVQLDHLNSSGGGKGNYGGGIGGAHDYDDSSGYDHPYTSFTNLVEMDAGDYVQIALAEVAHSGQLDLQAQGFTSNFWGCLMF